MTNSETEVDKNSLRTSDVSVSQVKTIKLCQISDYTLHPACKKLGVGLLLVMI